MVIPGFAVLMLFAACGSNNGSGSTVAAVGTCSIGYVYSTTYGCITQGSCPAGSGSYNNTCVPATASQCGIGGSTTSTYPYTTGTAYPSGYNGYNNGLNNTGCSGTTGYPGTYGTGYGNPGYVQYPYPSYPVAPVVYYGGGFGGGGHRGW
jgi:hypothetical protein